MSFKEILIHRLRDFDSVKNLQKKSSALKYVILRQFSKVFSFPEEKFKYLIRDNKSRFLGYTFNTRKECLDFLFFSKYYEPETTKFILSKKGNTFLDIGGHIGRYAIITSKNYKKGVIFEPHPQNFKQLKANTDLNRIKNLVLVNEAISSKKGFLKMDALEANTGAATLSKKGKFKIKVSELDTQLEKLKITPAQVDLVLVDAEKHEFEVLLGSKQFLKETNAELIIECFDLDKLKKFMSKEKFKFVKSLDFHNHLFTKQ